jgi:uncharacterized protein YndB with AHSA1/START domain
MDFTLHRTAVIEAPPDDVFAVITDIDHLPDWNAEIPRVLESPAALEVGTQWLVEIHALGTHWNSRSQVVELDRSRRRFAYRSVSDDGNPSFADWTWDVADDPAGSRVTAEVHVNPRTFWRKHLLSTLRRPSLDKAVQRSLRTLPEQVVAR